MIVGIDPGKNVGIAYVDQQGRLLGQHIVTLWNLVDYHLPRSATLVLGDGTGSQDVQAILTQRHHTFTLIDEGGTSLEARELYKQHYPARGWQRLLPKGLRPTPASIDHYAAYAIALRYLRTLEHPDH